MMPGADQDWPRARPMTLMDYARFLTGFTLALALFTAFWVITP